MDRVEFIDRVFASFKLRKLLQRRNSTEHFWRFQYLILLRPTEDFHQMLCDMQKALKTSFFGLDKGPPWKKRPLRLDDYVDGLVNFGIFSATKTIMF